ncbi:MAG: adenosylcobinamide-phosphate synthase CbiB [Deltaproteobacteria bacterium]|jgi:adenosylcobinamide-phosphate synthase|nr:adenosylcobinamide-phosphate synthase CbiB [Deltaproteobacteria bacterium]
MTSLITAASFCLDWLIGDPQRWPHPVRLIGRLISLLEKLYRRLSAKAAFSPGAVRLFGALLALTVVIGTGLVSWALLSWAGRLSSVLWYLLCLYLVYAAICLKDLLNHANNVENALKDCDLEEARRALSWIVGRDTGALDEAAIRRAVIETLAENFSDGLVAPLFYLALGGPVLAWMYKAVNTLDSMVGYKNEMYLNLGRFSAKLDDAANYLPARLASLLLIAAARLSNQDWRKAFRLWRFEGRLHSSPNSGQTEAAMAGALGVWLGGSSRYGGLVIDKPILGQGGKEASQAAVLLAEKILTVGTVLALLGAICVELILSFTLSAPWGWGM